MPVLETVEGEKGNVSFVVPRTTDAPAVADVTS